MPPNWGILVWVCPPVCPLHLDRSRTVRVRILKVNMWNKHERDPCLFFLSVGLVIAELCPFFDFCIVNLWNLVNKISRDPLALGS